MGAFNINTYYGCASCEAADKYGNGCKHGLMFPFYLSWQMPRNVRIISSKINLLAQHNKKSIYTLLKIKIMKIYVCNTGDQVQDYMKFYVVAASNKREAYSVLMKYTKDPTEYVYESDIAELDKAFAEVEDACVLYSSD